MFDTPQQGYIAVSKYARYLDDKGRRETWPETVQRYFDFAREHVGANYPQALPVWEAREREMFDSTTSLETMPSMRLLMTAGEAVKRNNVAAYNCAYTAVSQVSDFSDILLVLMHGTGVGFSCERQSIAHLPAVPAHLSRVSTTLAVEDSKEGWADAYFHLLSHLYRGAIPQVDYRQVRPRGSRLKVFGGRASGPEPLIRLFDFTVSTFREAAGRKLTSIEVHDVVCMIADIVVVGGVRRSALISLSNLSDRRMRDAKAGAWWEKTGHRALANNSAVYTERPDAETFLEEWLALVKSKSGERGIFNRQAAQKQAAKWGRRSADTEYGCNPCCVSGDTQILTDRGTFDIADMVGVEVNVWNGERFSSVTPFSVGVQPTLRVSLSNGAVIRCTPNHKFITASGSRGSGLPVRVEAKDLVVGTRLFKYTMPEVETGSDPDVDAYSQGFYSGDGNTGLRHSLIYFPKYGCIPRLIGRFGEEQSSCKRRRWFHGQMFSKNYVPMNATLSYRLNWLAGLLDSDGTVTLDENGNGLQIGSIDTEFLDQVRIMLTTMGVQAKVVKMHAARSAEMPDGKGGTAMYDCKAVNRVLIGNTDTCALVKLGLKLERLKVHGRPPQRDARRFVTVLSVEPAEAEEHFCFDEPYNHTGTFNGVVTGQSEILLRPRQFCNLTEVVIRASDTLQDLARKVRICTDLGVFQSTLTHFPGISPEYTHNCEEERLLGVSMTGVMDHPVLNTVSDEAVEWLVHLRGVARDQAENTAKLFGVNVSAAITCNKPSGTVAQLTNAGTGGLHPRYSKHYVRTYRQDNKDPLTQFMKDVGVRHEPSFMKPDSETIFSFVVESPEGAVMRHDRTAIEQLEHWLMFQRHWCEHKPSITIYVKDNEWAEVGAWAFKHFDEVCGVSFLPFDNGTYQQAPFQEISAEEFAAWPQFDIDWTMLHEGDDLTVSSQELACVGGACSI